MSPVFSHGFYISVNMALLLGATPLLDCYYPLRSGSMYCAATKQFCMEKINKM